MKKFFFREAKLLALRKQQVTIAELAVASAAQQVTSAKEALDMEMETINALSSRIMNSKSHGFTHASQTALGLRINREATINRLRLREEELAVAVKSLAQAKAAVEPLRELRIRRMSEFKGDYQKHEQSDLDYFATRDWMMQEPQPYG